ncbi:MAG: hypothetical protein ONB16_05365 [candidate division KSB1 bacterium]|nr:hypothetical protein [candidate division KSB1 bacterium]MDZ7318437.1 hypothetical protein [candidate division KSB1 bacterium]MDZ7342522.1 hypothetical protein [candidate division KSB1 bacterium]
MHWYRQAILNLILACGLFNNSTIAQTPSVDKELLANISIMETVLDRLLFPERNQFPLRDASARGYYLMNYGVIFNVRSSPFTNRIVVHNNLRKFYESHEDNMVYIETKDDEKGKATDFAQEIVKLKKSIARFMGSWTAAVIALPPQEKVTVIVDFENHMLPLAGRGEESIKQLIASVSIADIIDYRRGRLTDDEFIKRISFQEQRSMDEDVAILSNVIRTSLEQPADQFPWGISGEVRGIYFKGYGAVFFADVIPGRSSAFAYKEFLDRVKDRSLTVRGSELASKVDEFKKEKIEQKLIQLMSNYGFNLRNLATDEWLEVAINYKGNPIDGQYSRIIFKVQKRTIDDFQREKIKFDQFKKLVQVVYY